MKLTTAQKHQIAVNSIRVDLEKLRTLDQQKVWKMKTSLNFSQISDLKDVSLALDLVCKALLKCRADYLIRALYGQETRPPSALTRIEEIPIIKIMEGLRDLSRAVAGLPGTATKSDPPA